ncbi:hypothetical protein LGT41_0005330 [Abyssibius alkaniclasticus]|uniref:hypothetical protein n=1 Tax=Abyssibius alkaniclasticus TaxID=2881234 RepID=UPI002364A33A|nr:hypothetical protein [Abyssibius alkaniclasticus]UPH72239.1 hypothetical protein LGT41_0005330 [Abyssibius alkaniclasticus]
MLIIDADPTRMIDLPGVGPCPRPVDIDQSVTGFKRLKSLRIYSFQPEVTIEGESEGDEVFVLPLGGTVAMEIAGEHPLSAHLSDMGDCALYMMPDHAYTLRPQSHVRVAYARAAASGRIPSYTSDAQEGNTAEALAYQLADLANGAMLSLPANRERLVHLRHGALMAGDRLVRAPQTLALAKGESVSLCAKGAARVLVLSA